MNPSLFLFAISLLHCKMDHRAPRPKRTSVALSLPMTCSALDLKPLFHPPCTILSPVLTHPLDRFPGGQVKVIMNGMI